MTTLTERYRNFTGNNEALTAILDEAATNIANEDKAERYEFADQMAAMQFVVDTYIQDVLNEARIMQDHDYVAIAYLMYNYNRTLDEAIDDYENVSLFRGSYKELAYDLYEQGCYGECSKELEAYLDWDFMAKELRYDYLEYEFDKKKYIIRAE